MPGDVPPGDGYVIRLEDPKSGATDLSDASFRIVVAKRPDLYIAGLADLVSGTGGRPLKDAMWVKVGNQGTVTARDVRVSVYFWGLAWCDPLLSGCSLSRVSRDRPPVPPVVLLLASTVSVLAECSFVRRVGRSRQHHFRFLRRRHADC